MVHDTCPAREELADYALGQLGAEQQERIAAHVDSCSACQGVLETLADTDDPLVHLLRARDTDDPFAAERECQQALDRISAFGATEQNGDAKNESRRDIPESIRDYRLLEVLGAGGMGTVYKALHTKLDKLVALKILPDERTADRTAIARFQREMKAVGRVDHPNIVTAFDAGEDQGTDYLVMQYVEGLDLSKLARLCGPIDTADACELIRQAATGLQHAHEQGMVHRDIKPSNLMLASVSESGSPSAAPVVKVLDLGLALLAEGRSPQTDLTATGQMMGTLDYMAPEQGTGDHAIDIRADVYALGATLYRLLVGRPPLVDSPADTPMKKAVALATRVAPPIGERRSDLPGELASIVDRMLKRKPEDRPSTPAEVAEALVPFCEGSDLRALLAQGRAASSTPSGSPESPDNATSDSKETVAVDDNIPPDFTRTLSVSSDKMSARRTSNRPLLAIGGVCSVVLIAAIVTWFRGDDEPVTDDRSPSANDTTGDIDREVAEWIVRTGGEVGVRSALDGYVEVQPHQELPAGELKLAVARLIRVESLRDQDLARFDKLKHLTTLILSVTSITNDGIRRLGDLPALTELYLYDTDVSDAGLEQLDRYPNLTRLFLNTTKTTNAGLVHVARHRGLVVLDLIGCPITDDGLNELYELKELRMLKLDATRVTATGVEALQKKLPDCDIQWTSTQTATARDHEVAKWLHAMGAKFGLTVDGAGFVDVMPDDELPNGKVTVETVSLAGLTDVTDEDMARFDQLAKMRLLTLSETHVGDKGLQTLGTLPELESLYLYKTNVTDVGVAELTRFPNLKLLHLSRTGLSDRGLRHVAPLTELTELDLSGCRIGDAGIGWLRTLLKLKTLRLHGTDITASTIFRLKALLPGCDVQSDISEDQVVAVTESFASRHREVAESLLTGGSKCGIAGPDGYINVDPGGELPAESFLLIVAGAGENESFGDSQLMQLSGLPMLGTVVVSATSVTDKGLQSLNDLPLLGHLFLWKTKVTDDGLKGLSRFPLLELVHLADTSVTNVGVAHLVENTELKELDLVRCPITDDCVPSLLRLKRLKVLRIHGTALSEDAVKRLQAGLPDCRIESQFSAGEDGAAANQ